LDSRKAVLVTPNSVLRFCKMKYKKVVKYMCLVLKAARAARSRVIVW
jgi:hypothetical protein